MLSAQWRHISWNHLFIEQNHPLIEQNRLKIESNCPSNKQNCLSLNETCYPGLRMCPNLGKMSGYKYMANLIVSLHWRWWFSRGGTISVTVLVLQGGLIMGGPNLAWQSYLSTSSLCRFCSNTSRPWLSCWKKAPNCPTSSQSPWSQCTTEEPPSPSTTQ